MAMLVTNPATNTQSWHMRIQFHTVAMPHGQLFLWISEVWRSRSWVPSPYLERVQQIKLPGQFTGSQQIEVSHKVTVYVIRVIFVLNK